MDRLNILKKKSLILSGLFLTCLSLISCDKDHKWFKGANIGINLNEYGEVKASAGIAYDLGGFQLPTLIIPIVDPNNPNQDLGQINLTRHGLAFQLSVNNFLGLDKGAGLLPNGDEIPMSGLKGVEVVELASEEASLNEPNNSTVYIAAGAGVSMVGIAVIDERFGEIAQENRGFRAFEMENGVRGSIGVFLDEATGKSGIAVFFDMSSAIAPSQLVEVGEGVLFNYLDTEDQYSPYDQSQIEGVDRNN